MAEGVPRTVLLPVNEGCDDPDGRTSPRQSSVFGSREPTPSRHLPSEVSKADDHADRDRLLELSSKVASRPRQLHRDTWHETRHDEDAPRVLGSRGLRGDEQDVPDHRDGTPGEDERPAEVLLVRQVGYAEREDAG